MFALQFSDFMAMNRKNKNIYLNRKKKVQTLNNKLDEKFLHSWHVRTHAMYQFNRHIYSHIFLTKSITKALVKKNLRLIQTCK